jgi:Mg-chelatase subunit ChlI
VRVFCRSQTCLPLHLPANSPLSSPDIRPAFLDRIDIQVEVPAVPYKDLMRESNTESSAEIRKHVAASRAIQSERFARIKIYCNAQMSSRHIKKHCQIDTASRNLLESAIDKLGLSARAFNRILKIARTIADLQAEPNLQVVHISEAIQYRNLDRKAQFPPGKRVSYTRIGLKFQSRRKNINLDNKTRFSYPEGYCLC